MPCYDGTEKEEQKELEQLFCDLMRAVYKNDYGDKILSKIPILTLDRMEAVWKRHRDRYNEDGPREWR